MADDYGEIPPIEPRFDRREIEEEWGFANPNPGGTYFVAAVTFAGVLFIFLKKTGKATKEATQSRYSIPLMCVK